MTDEQTITEPTTDAPVDDGSIAGNLRIDDAATATEPASVDQLPAWAQKELSDARKDAAKYRTTAQQKDADTAALLERLSVAAGFKTDDKADPAALTQQLTAAQQAQKDTAIQLAVYRAAGQHQGNPDALLDSKTFLANVSALDPAGADFNTQVADAIKAAVASNSSLRQAQAVTTSSAADHAGGSGERGPITEQQLASMKPEQIAEAMQAGRLKHLL